MVDCDPQRTTSDWIQVRNSDPSLPAINCIQLYGKIRNDLISLAQHYDYVVIPLRPKRRDLKTVPHMEGMLSTCKMVNPKMLASFVMTQCPSLPNQARRILEAKDVCRSFGINVLNALTYNRNVYDDSEELMAMKSDNAHEFN